MRRREKLTTEDATGHSRGSGDKLRWQEAAPALRAGPRSQKAERGLRQCSPPPAKPHGQGCRAARAHGRRLVAAARPISRPQSATRPKTLTALWALPSRDRSKHWKEHHRGQASLWKSTKPPHHGVRLLRIRLSKPWLAASKTYSRLLLGLSAVSTADA